MKISSIISIIWTLLSYVFSQRSSGREYTKNDYTNLRVKRTIDLENKIIKISSSILIKSKKVDPLYTYRYAILQNTSDSLVHISAKMKSPGGEEEVGNIKMSYLGTEGQYDLYNIMFRTDPMNNEEERLLEVQEDYFVRVSFFPERIALKEDQFVLFTDSTVFISAYPTLTQVTTVKLPDEKTHLIRYTMKKANKIKNTIVYKYDTLIDPFTFDELYLHYENNRPMTTMQYANKIFEVSHWGNIAVQESYQIVNIGAKLEGEFSRVDYDEYGRFGKLGGKSALRSINAKLPLRSWGLWYRDEIGNVSTSVATREWDDVNLLLHPRFPIFGGWKSNFDIGYNLPSKFHISTDDEGSYMVNLTFGMPYVDLLALNYSVKVVLPEGAENIQVFLPIDSKYMLENDKVKGCLDLFGRPAVTIQLKNVYDIHKVYFQIKYNYSYTRLLFKPIIVIFYFLMIFMGLIIYFRAELSLSQNEKEKTD